MALALNTARTGSQAPFPVTFAETGIDAVLDAAAADLKAERPAAAAEHVANLNPAFVASPERCHLAGLILVGAEDWSNALIWFARARSLRPTYVEAIAQTANVLQKLGRFEEALSAFDEALRLGLADAGAHYNRGLVLRALGRSDEALASLDRALKLKPAHPEALRAGAAILTEAGRFESALEFLDEAVRLRPDFFEAVLDRANLLHRLERLDAALAAYQEALTRFPGRADLCNNCGVVWLELGDLQAGLASFDAALAAKPDFPEGHFNRGTVLLKLGPPKEALSAFNAALALRPVYPAALVGRGVALKELGQWNEAEASFDLALAQDPESAHAKSNKGALQLLRGDFRRGWDGYEYRWISGLASNTKLQFAIPEWKGESHPGEKLLVFDEQGFGDTLQFCRYLPLLARAGVDVTLFCSSKMKRLLRSLGPNIQCVDDLAPHDRFDSQIALSSLPRAFKTDLATIPARVPYLFAEPGRVAKWAERLASRGYGRTFKIGLCWHGNANVKADPARSLPLASFARLAARDDLRLISLQKYDGLDELARMPKMRIEILGDDFDAGLDAFVDTAAIMQTLDLIITCDTSIAHLAGALGRPVFVLLKKIPDWRWLLEREDSPWYPTMRLFRQRERDDWNEVVTRLITATEMMMAYTSGLQALRSAAMM